MSLVGRAVVCRYLRSHHYGDARHTTGQQGIAGEGEGAHWPAGACRHPERRARGPHCPGECAAPHCTRWHPEQARGRPPPAAFPESLVLVDTAVWVDHLRGSDPVLISLLEEGRVSVHPFVVGEIACGNLTQRAAVLESMQALLMLPVVRHLDVLNFVEEERLAGSGLGWIDVHLLASASAADEPLLTRDRRLRAAAEKLGLAARV
ncbi:MAG: PIN domain-containing protein [Chromatiales bacterium]|nr:PIN domain-containing protein [Chromatiales bacterium]